jgi:hypothetical protein
MPDFLPLLVGSYSDVKNWVDYVMAEERTEETLIDEKTIELSSLFMRRLVQLITLQ